MGKLSLGLIGCLLTLSAAAQDSLYVFQLTGETMVTVGQRQQAAKKGALLTAASSLNLGNGAALTAIDKLGNTYVAAGPGTVNFGQLASSKGNPTNSSMTAQYLQYVWKEFMGGDKSATVVGTTFRGDLRMMMPIDSAKVVRSKVQFSWSTDSLVTAYYLFIRNVETGEVSKFETDGSRLALYGENNVFAEGNYFEWTVSTEAFPNLNNLPFYAFELIDRNTYKQLETVHQAFIDDLQALGMNDSEISRALCETFGICRFL